MHGLFTDYRMATQTDNAPPARVLVADDQPDVLEALRWLLTGEGYEPDFVTSTEAVLERLRSGPYDLLLMDLNYSRDTTSGREGLELIPKVRGLDAVIPIVVMTGWGSIDTAVEAMRRGAKSFVQKPWEDVTLLEILEREIADGRLARRHHRAGEARHHAQQSGLAGAIRSRERDELAHGPLYLKESNLERFSALRHTSLASMFGL